MSSKRWFFTFIASVFLLVGLWGGLNVAVDPFGVFGDRILNWYSYNMTLNPRVAKTAYLEKHHSKYDSYIIGASSTSSYPVDDLNRYYGASFYNLIMYGADMYDVELTAAYLIENYEVKNLIVNVYIDNGITYNYGEDTITNNLHVKVTGGNKLDFYGQYLFLNPQFAIEKLKDRARDTYLPQTFDVFDPETGAYDKRKRDVENIGDMGSYLQAYPVFENYPKAELTLPNTDRCMTSLAKVRDMCREAGINFVVVSAPVYCEYLDNFKGDQVLDFYTKLADVGPFWDFTMSSVSCDPRYFYDATHFRNTVGAMALARMFGAEDIYIPEDFGVLVTPENVEQHVLSYGDTAAQADGRVSRDVPILMYHHLTEEGDGASAISVTAFESQIEALVENGFTAVSFEDLINYVDRGMPLPEKPVVITFDDGYLSNYELAYPLLEKHGMKATIFVIGCSVGHMEFYKDTSFPITPHFSYDQAAEMVRSGIISVQSHTYDMHQWEPYEDEEPARTSVLMFEGEDELSYMAALTGDFERSRDEIESATGEPVRVLAYPNGAYDQLSQSILTGLGVEVTLTTIPGINTVVKGLPQSLLALKRFGMTDSVGPDQLIEAISKPADKS